MKGAQEVRAVATTSLLGMWHAEMQRRYPQHELVRVIEHELDRRHVRYSAHGKQHDVYRY